MVKIVENALVVYTDGSLYPRGRKGGYGIVFLHINEIGQEFVLDDHAPPGVRGTTNNRMELTAVIEAMRMAGDLECYAKVDRLVIRTDSQYVQKHFNSSLSYWIKNKWRDHAGRPIENMDLWKDFARERKKIRKRFEIEKVKAHARGRAKDPYNAMADTLAKSSANNPLSRAEFHSSVRRKKGSGKTKKGSIAINGQTMAVFIIETKRLKQREWKYRYQVDNGDGTYGAEIDWIYSKLALRDGHSYRVIVNSDMEYPQILELIE